MPRPSLEEDSPKREPRPTAAAPPSKVEVQNVRRERWIARAGVVLSLAALAVPAVLPAGHGTAATFAILGALAAYFWSAIRLAGTDRGGEDRRLASGSAEITADRLTITSKGVQTTLPLSQLEGGWAERVASAHRAVLSFKDGRVAAVETASEAEAAALLERAGAGAGARAVRMRGYREAAGGRKIAAFFAAFFGLLVVPSVLLVPVMLYAAISSWSAEPLRMLAGTSIGFLPLFLVFRWMWRKVRPTWIQIGVDGVVLQGVFGKRFVPHADIEHARHRLEIGAGAEDRVEIAVRGGKKYVVPVESGAVAAAVCDRIREASAATRGQERARLLDVLARGDRSVSEWKRALESLVAPVDYRSAGRDLEDVMRIVEDAQAPLEQRVAAALAARPTGGESAQKRIRVAVEASVDPRVRLALEKAAEGTLDDAVLGAIGSADRGVAETGVAEMGVAKMGVAKMGVAEVGAGEVGVAETRGARIEPGPGEPPKAGLRVGESDESDEGEESTQGFAAQRKPML